MHAKKKLGAIARKKYAKWREGRKLVNRTFHSRLAKNLERDCIVTTDSCPRYPSLMREFHPTVAHKKVMGGRGSVVGLGELRERRFDEMFALNHTCAMIRDSLAMMRRRTWCTTKKITRLLMLLRMYAIEHNKNILESLAKKKAKAAQV